jgi:alpha-tubulin suppressor-like RCC1 family protein
MTFGVNDIITRVNNATACTTLTPLQLLQASGSVSQFINMDEIFSVACDALLPSAGNNTGRLVYILNTCQYKFSNGSAWSNDFSSLTSQAYAWGNNKYGALGNNNIAASSSPVSVVSSETNWHKLSAGGSGNSIWSLGITATGTLWSWGNNSYSQLGTTGLIPTSSPALVAGGIHDWCQVSAGNKHAVAVRENGTASAWGLNNFGQLGLNDTTTRQTPVQISLVTWCQLSAGFLHTLAIRTNGTAWAWGSNSNGQVGDNTSINKLSPVSVVGGFTNWCQVSAGQNFSLGVRTNGTAWAWGSSDYGKLGDNTTVSKSSPVSVVGGFTDWCQVSAGSESSLAVRQNGTAWAWGSNSNGQLGDNTTVSKSSPVSVVGGFTNWCQVSAGQSHSLGVRQNGLTWAWGSNSNGQLGDSTTTNRSSPVSVIGGFTDWWEISAGGNFSLATRKSCGF